MATYKIRDTQTGKVYSLRGDSPPTQQELEQIFGAGRDSAPPPPPTSQPENQPGMMQKLAGGFSSIFTPRMKSMGQQLTTGSVLNQQLPGVRDRQDQQFSQSRQMIQKAQRETDPVKKREMLDMSRNMDQFAGQEIDSLLGEHETANKIQDGGQLPSYLRTGIGVGGEMGAMLAPQVKAFQGTSAAGRIGNAALSGGLRGGISGITDPYTQSVGEHAGKTAMVAGAGAATGAAFQAGGELIKKLGGATKGRFEEAVKQFRAEQPGTEFTHSPTVGEKMMTSRYTIPHKVAKDIRLEDTLKTMKDYNLANLDLDDQMVATQLTTGQNGAITGMTYETLLETSKPIYVDKAMTAASEKTWNFATPQQVANTTRDISNDFANAGIQPDPKGWTARPLDAFKLAQTLEKKAYAMGYNKSTYLTQNLQAEDIGDMYMSAARTLLDTIDDSAGAQAVEAAKKPEYIAQLAAVSPQLAEKAQNASSFSELRGIAAPFVRLSKAITMTKEAQNSAMVKYIQSQQGGLSLNPVKLASEAAGNTIFSPDNIARAGSVVDTLADVREAGGQMLQTPMAQGTGNFLQRLGTIGTLGMMNQPQKVQGEQYAR